jgi:hypothetical protein
MQTNILPGEESFERRRRLGMVLVLLFGLARAWIGRFSMDADGLSYLDLSDAFRRYDFHNFLNAYWSPLYPMLLGLGRILLPASKRGELIAAHVVNFLIYAAALACFEFFYRALRESMAGADTGAGSDAVHLPEWALWPAAHALFLWVSLDLITIWSVAADLCVSAFVYLVAGLLLLFRADPSWKLAALLGIALGASYWSKAVMFPLAFAFVAIALLSTRSLTLAIQRGVVILLFFAVVAAPLVIALSRQKHRFTFGDSGRINYAMFVSPGGVTRNWQGEPRFGITAAHPTRKLSSDPALYEFAEPIAGTFPPWYDPSYWEEGRIPRFNLRAQVRMVSVHLLSYAELLLHQENCLLAAWLALLMVAGKNSFAGLRRTWPPLLMGCAALGLYMLVHVETRFVAVYIAILWPTLFFSLRVPANLRRFCGYLLLAASATLLISVVDNTARAIRDGGPSTALPDVALSDGLDTMGLHGGDRIVVLGGQGFYAARLSRVRIVAEIMPEDMPAFWRLSPEERDVIFKKMAQTGARAVIAPDPAPAMAPDPTWIRVDGLPYYLRWL